MSFKPNSKMNWDRSFKRQLKKTKAASLQLYLSKLISHISLGILLCCKRKKNYPVHELLNIEIERRKKESWGKWLKRIKKNVTFTLKPDSMNEKNTLSTMTFASKANKWTLFKAIARSHAHTHTTQTTHSLKCTHIAKRVVHIYTKLKALFNVRHFISHFIALFCTCSEHSFDL